MFHITIMAMTEVKLKVNSQFKIFSTVNGQATTFFELGKLLYESNILQYGYS